MPVNIYNSSFFLYKETFIIKYVNNQLVRGLYEQVKNIVLKKITLRI